MGDKTNKELPQVGTGSSGESHPSLAEGCPTDSGGDNQPLEQPKMERDENPFRRRDSIPRSPPNRNRSFSVPDLKEAGSLNVASGTGGLFPALLAVSSITGSSPPPTRRGSVNKRRRVATPEKAEMNMEGRTQFLERMEKQRKMLQDIIMKTTKEVKTLRTLITEIPNTKKEIKTAISRLEGYTRVMPTAAECVEEMINEYENVSELLSGRFSDKITTEIGTQTVSKKQEEKEMLVTTIESELSKDLNEDALVEVMELRWPEEVYKKCKNYKGVNRQEDEEDLIVVMNPGEEAEDVILQRTGIPK